jgi:hypothetical protein
MCVNLIYEFCGVIHNFLNIFINTSRLPVDALLRLKHVVQPDLNPLKTKRVYFI